MTVVMSLVGATATACPEPFDFAQGGPGRKEAVSIRLAGKDSDEWPPNLGSTLLRFARNDGCGVLARSLPVTRPARGLA